MAAAAAVAAAAAAAAAVWEQRGLDLLVAVCLFRALLHTNPRFHVSAH